MRSQYFLFVFVCLAAFVALLFLKNISAVMFIFIVEAILILGGVELLHRRMPQQLREARSDNCLRIDGSFSHRRLERERQALAKVRMDLLAVFLLIALSGNWLAFFLHCEVIPLNVAMNAASEFDADTQTWKQRLRDSGVDKTFEEWSVSKAQVDHATVEAQQQLLWYAWPLIIVLVICWMIGSATFLYRAYTNTIRAYALGVASRAEYNVNLDIGRLQANSR